MNLDRRHIFLLLWSLAFLAACSPAQTAMPIPTVTTMPTAARPEIPTASAPTATISITSAPLMTAQPSSTVTPVDTPTAAVPSLTPEPKPTLTVAPPTSQPPTKAPFTSEPPTTVSPTSGPPTPCAFAWFVTNPPPACPGQAPIYSQTVAEHFERGVVIWREKPDFYGSQIYAFFTDNKWPYWNPTNDQWRPTMPESDPTIVPPAGFFQPVRGFGIFWRNAYFGAAAGSARDRLGWATDQEFALGQLPMQCRVGPDRSYGCLVAGPDNRVYDIEPDNSWSLWPGSVMP